MISVSTYSRLSWHNEYSKNGKSNNFEAWKHGHVVAAVLSRAQLWYKVFTGSCLPACSVKSTVNSGV